jgi:DNA-binding protein H-NS
MKLDKMSDAKLNALLKEVSAEVARREKENSAAAKAEKELAALSKKYGSEIIKRLAANTKQRRAAAPAKKRAKVKPVYRNPDNPQQVWTGRGRVPLWVGEAEERHGGREALKIENQG